MKRRPPALSDEQAIDELTNPPRFRILSLVLPNSPTDWLSETLQSATDNVVTVRAFRDLAAAVGSLRQWPCDAVVIEADPLGPVPLDQSIGSLRKNASPHLPVIVLTSSPTATESLQCLQAGATLTLCLAQTSPQELTHYLQQAVDHYRIALDYERLLARHGQQAAREKQELLLQIERQRNQLLRWSGGDESAAIDQRLLQAIGELIQARFVTGDDANEQEISALREQLHDHQTSPADLVTTFYAALMPLIQQREVVSARRLFQTGQTILIALLSPLFAMPMELH